MTKFSIFLSLARAGGRTWKKWTKYILAEKIFLKKDHLDKMFGILPSWGAMAPWPPRYGPEYSTVTEHVYMQFDVITFKFERAKT